MLHANKAIICTRCKKQTIVQTLDGNVHKGQTCTHCWAQIAR